MTTTRLTEPERWAILNAIQVAIVQYRKDATERAYQPDEFKRLRQLFLDQAARAQALYDRLEQATAIVLEDE